jgi:hypothetical protein
VSWSEIEQGRAAAIIADIDSCIAPRRRTERVRNVRLAVSEIENLFDGIWGGFPVTFIRHLYRELGFDEHHVFKWRLEHKLIQALVLNHYAPGCMPATCGLDEFKRCGGSTLQPALEARFPSGFYLKPALGDSSGDCNAADRNQQMLAACEEQILPPGSDLVSEKFLVQEQIPIAVEYRVHTLEDRVVEDLTFHRYGTGDIPGERDAPNAFVQSILDRLPNALVAGTLCGWDIARTPQSNFVTIEVNFSGLHPVHNRGFQCSGWFHDEHWGGLSTARLLRFLEDRCGVSVSIEADRPELKVATWYYTEVERCRNLLRNGALS